MCGIIVVEGIKICLPEDNDGEGGPCIPMLHFFRCFKPMCWVRGLRPCGNLTDGYLGVALRTFYNLNYLVEL